MSSPSPPDSAAAPTRLYECIQRCDWNSALRSLRLRPEEAAAWVALPPDDLDPTTTAKQRFLPLHSAAARNPPRRFLRALVDAHRDALAEKDAAGMLPLHYACGNRCPPDVLRVLLSCDDADAAEGAWERDANGMTPLHCMASWGPSEAEALELLREAAAERTTACGRTLRDWISMRDVRGMTPWMLANEAEYEGKDEVLAVLERWLDDEAGEVGGRGRGPGRGRADDRVGLQVVAAAPSPTSPAPSKIQTNSRFETATPRRPSPRRGGTDASRRFARDDAETTTMSTAPLDEDKRAPPLPSPRSAGSDSRSSRDYPIHMMDDRRSPSDDSRSGGAVRHASTWRDSLLDDDRDDDHHNDRDIPSRRRTRRDRYSITVSDSPLQQHHSSSSASTTATPHPHSAVRTESPNTPTIMNMKTPRSSGRGGRFQFDPSPSPRYAASSIASPATRTLLSPRGQPSPLRAPPTATTTTQQQQQQHHHHRLEEASELLQRLHLENETLRRESSRNAAENCELRAELSRRDREARDSASPLAAAERVRAALRSLAERERALAEVVRALQRRERRRAERTRHLWKWLEEEEQEEEEGVDGGSWEKVLGREMECLEEVRVEIGKMLEEGFGE